MKRALLVVALGAACAPAAQEAGSPRAPRTSIANVPAAQWERMLAAEDARAATPADAAVLRNALASGDAAVRTMAVRALGRTERREFEPDIVRMLRDADNGVRAAAAHALGNITRDSASAGAREQLLQAMSGPAGAGALSAAAETVGRLRHDSAAARAVALRLAALLQLEHTSAGALRGMYFVARQAPARSHVARFAGDALRSIAAGAADPHERVLALATLSAAGAVTGPVIRAAITDVDWTVRREAVAATAGVQDAGAADAVLGAALVDAVPQVRYEAVRVYARRSVATGGCTPVIRAMRDADMHVALLAIGLSAGPCRDNAPIALLDSIASTLSAADWQRAASATLALAMLDRPEAGAHLQRLAQHASPFARAWAARAAAARGDISLLHVLAGDPHHNVRHAAVEGMRTRLGRAGDSIYIAQLGQDDSELLQVAALALEGTQHRDAIHWLLDALDRVTRQQAETSRDARSALLVRIREVGTRAHADRLTPYLRDFDHAIAARAAEIITHWTGTAVTAAPQPLPRLSLPTHADALQLARSRFVIELEGGGEIVIALQPWDAPTNAWRFARLARSGYFDGLTIHRVVPNFVVQGGSPGANEYSGDALFTRDELGVSNVRGSVGLSTRGRDTGDAQFYINTVDNVRLDHEYTIFGSVVSGMEHVDRVREGAVIRRVREVR